MSQLDTISMFPSALPAFYQKKMITICHQDIGGVRSARCRFIHYTCWQGVQSCPSLMTRDHTLPRTLQTALSDTIGATRGRTFELRTGLDPPKAIGVLSSSPQACPKLVYSGDAVGPDLSTIPLRDWFIWVWAHSVFSMTPVLHQAKTSELMAIWDYERKLESWGWSQEQSLRVLSAWLLSPPGKMLRRFLQSISNAILLKLCQVDCQTPDEVHQ